jgi:CPA1 family monovalent cation:H+ antiporter
MNINFLDQAALLLGVTAVLSYINHYVLRLPRNIGLLVLALVMVIVLRVGDAVVPGLALGDALRKTIEGAEFAPLLLNGVLGFLLFAGATKVEFAPLARRKWTILALATVGVLLATGLVGVSMWLLFGALGTPVPLFYCLAFGALIAPTDPVTVLGQLERTAVPEGLRAIIAGESLFNDGIGIVLYSLCVSAAAAGHDQATLGVWAYEFLREAGGGLCLGLGAGGLAFLATRGIDEYGTELVISLALVSGTYGVANTVGVSGPVAVVVAGLIMGNVGVRYAVSETTHDYLEKFWSLVDEVLNALLYLLVGLEFVAVTLDQGAVETALAATIIVLLARLVSVSVPSIPLNIAAANKFRAVTVITWSGLRGGISLALALSLPASPFRPALITATYAVVIFTMLLQGLSLHRLVTALYPPPPADARA